MPPKQFPTLTTARLLLRKCSPADAPDIQRLAGDRDVASTTVRIPHPYEDGMAEEWIGTHQGSFDRGEEVSLAVTLRSDGAFIGDIGLRLNLADEVGEMATGSASPIGTRGTAPKPPRPSSSTPLRYWGLTGCMRPTSNAIQLRGASCGRSA